MHRLLLGEQTAQAENVRALNTTLQALFGLMKAVIHQSGPQADDEGARMVREAAERVEKGQVRYAHTHTDVHLVLCKLFLISPLRL